MRKTNLLCLKWDFLLRIINVILIQIGRLVYNEINLGRADSRSGQGSFLISSDECFWDWDFCWVKSGFLSQSSAISENWVIELFSGFLIYIITKWIFTNLNRTRKIGSAIFFFFKGVQVGGEPGIFLNFVYFLSQMQRLRPLGYCAPNLDFREFLVLIKKNTEIKYLIWIFLKIAEYSRKISRPCLEFPAKAYSLFFLKVTIEHLLHWPSNKIIQSEQRPALLQHNQPGAENVHLHKEGEILRCEAPMFRQASVFSGASKSSCTRH